MSPHPITAQVNGNTLSPFFHTSSACIERDGCGTYHPSTAQL